MDSDVSGMEPTLQLRRSTRHPISASAKVVNYEPTPRGPLKRTKKSSKPQHEVPASNGTNNNDSDEEGSPSKKTCLQTGDSLAGGDGKGSPKDVSEPMDTQNQSEGLEGDVKASIKHSPPSQNPPVPSSFGNVNLKPLVVLGQRCALSHPESESVIKTKVEQPKTKSAPPSKCITQIIPPKKTSDTYHVPVTSMAEYKRKMEDKITENPKVNHYDSSSYSKSATTTRQRMTVSTPKTRLPEKKQEKKKTKVHPRNSGILSKGFIKYLVLLMLLSAGLFLAFKHLHTLQRTKDDSAQSPRSVNSGLFVEELSRVEMRFPSQRPELWRRSLIHLRKHLDTPHPTEPVSLVLTAGLKAEKTLHCLAHNIASAFSFAVNASVIAIDGASQANLDSDHVKMDIDSQLKAAFESDKLAAVVHRFEEFPPGSTLIFYRYCDHETAAYKQAFLLFTVLLSAEDPSTQPSLNDVEEMVRDHIEERFVGNETGFNKMDPDKFSGLWSRIAHLILPVAYEDEIERMGC